MSKKVWNWIGITSACIACGFVGWYIRVWYANSLPSKVIEIREDDNQYHYINPLLLVDSPRQAPEYNQLKNIIGADISADKNTGKASSVSVYFQDLNSGKWTGVNEDQVYDPSSMFKVAVMMGYLEAADSDPNVLLQKLDYTATVDPGQHYPPEHPLASGSYTVQDLIQAMITESDNTAMATLYNNGRDYFVDVLKELQIPPPPTASTTDFVSPKMYSTIFRTLYSATYLSKNVSEQALQLLTYTTFKNGLVAGVPAGTIVAHKFGEHTEELNGVPVYHELHDCGIVYYPGDPYFLCVMTKGQDFSSLEKVISTIASATYQFVSTPH